MKVPSENTKEQQKTVQRVSKETSSSEQATIVNNRPNIMEQRKLQTVMRSGDNKTVQLKPLDKKIDKNKLNIIGEDHDHSKNVRGAERKYTNNKFKGRRKSYWLEPELQYENGFETIFYVDSPTLYYLDKLCFLLLVIEAYERATATEEIDKGRELIKSNAKFLNDKVNEIVNFEDNTTLDKGNKLAEFSTFLRANRNLFDGLIKASNTRFDRHVKHLKPILEEKVNKFNIQEHRSVPLSAAYFFDNKNTYQDEENSYSVRRGQHMQRFAAQKGENFKGIWKVGNAHIQQISDYEDTIPDFERTNYTLIDREIFDEKIRYSQKDFMGKTRYNIENLLGNNKKKN